LISEFAASIFFYQTLSFLFLRPLKAVNQLPDLSSFFSILFLLFSLSLSIFGLHPISFFRIANMQIKLYAFFRVPFNMQLVVVLVVVG